MNKVGKEIGMKEVIRVKINKLIQRDGTRKRKQEERNKRNKSTTEKH